MTVREKGDLARFAVKEEERKSVSTTPVEGKKRPTTEQKRKLLRPGRDMKLSTSHIQDLDSTGIVDEGLRVVERHKDGEALYGWLEFKASDAIDLGLQVEYDPEPPRHTHIVGWPAIQGDRRDKELGLAEKSTPHPLDPPRHPK